jgi:hypothetical protein
VGLQATAVKTPCGQFFIVNGLKKWITNGAMTKEPVGGLCGCPPRSDQTVI